MVNNSIASLGGKDTAMDGWNALFLANNNSSIFVSQDPVAIDSVGADFLNNEPAVKIPIFSDDDAGTMSWYSPTPSTSSWRYLTSPSM